jgi:hypothetical protein
LITPRRYPLFADAVLQSDTGAFTAVVTGSDDRWFTSYLFAKGTGDGQYPDIASLINPQHFNTALQTPANAVIGTMQIGKNNNYHFPAKNPFRWRRIFVFGEGVSRSTAREWNETRGFDRDSGSLRLWRAESDYRGNCEASHCLVCPMCIPSYRLKPSNASICL